MGIRLDLTNQRFGRLLCLTLLDKRDKWGYTVWQCKCDCGRIVDVSTQSLRSKKTKSCGCMQLERCRLSKGDAAFNILFSTYCRNAKKRGIAFKITKKDFKKLSKQTCHYCGQEPSQIIKKRGYYGEYIYNGIDRIDNTKEYALNNCVPCCKDCNYMKRTLPVDVFITHVKRIVEYLKD